MRRWAPGVASVTSPQHDGEPCGDAALWLQHADSGRSLLAIVDGLGHGHDAAVAADAAVRALADAFHAEAARSGSGAQDSGAAQPPPDLAAWLQRADAALVPLRGAAVGLLCLHGGRAWHAGVGNTRVLRVRQGAALRLPSQNGIVGGRLPALLQMQAFDVLPGDWLLLFSDGLDERLGLPVLLPEWQRDPGLLCLHLLQRHRLPRDDAGVLVALVGAA